jgi:putative DNA methylase
VTVVKTRKKLIEVALPLEAINAAAAREKSIRHGHPSTLHLWWARRPLAAARAVIFAQMVDDPSSFPDLFKTEKAQEKERARLFRIIEDLVKWENTTNEAVLQKAREEIWVSWRRACAEHADDPRAKELFDRNKLPAFHDPFAGGGALPLEAQRMGLEAYASDLNPVAVLINKAMIEIPPKFAGKPPVNPAAQSKFARGARWNSTGAQGIAEDVRYYGQWLRDEAQKRIGHLYPKIEIAADMARHRPDLKRYVGQKLTVIAWLWARTVKSPNPAFGNVEVPLASTFMLSTKTGKEVYVEPVIEGSSYRFTVRVGKPKDAEAVKNGTKLSRGANFRCVMSGSPIAPDYIKAEGRAHRLGVRLMAIVAEGARERVYLSPMADQEMLARTAKPEWKPEQSLPDDPRNFWTVQYGLSTYGSLFTGRQLVALTMFSDLVHEARERVHHDAVVAGLPDGGKLFYEGGAGATAYADAVSVYLGMAVSKETVSLVTQARWRAGEGKSAPAFGRQAIPMVWDFADLNPFAGAGGDFLGVVEASQRVIEEMPASPDGMSVQANASSQILSRDRVVSTDPPYYDNIGYADLSDFFYVWLRQSLRTVFPDLFTTLAVPKVEELVATPYRHGGKEKAEKFFLDGMTEAMHRLAEQAHPAFPVTIYYAFKQSETESDAGTASTGWETFLDAVIRAGFAISGTWPMRTENQTRLVGMVTNALASSILLVCKPRDTGAYSATRREFVTSLKTELPAALRHLQAGNIAPVDLAQAAIGPGMAVYTRYAKVLDAEGKPVSVREALALINSTLDEALAEQEGDFDPESRWALAWFEQNGFAEGEYGVAETLSKAKNTSVAGLAASGILKSQRGKVRLLKPEELPTDWDPATDPRMPSWEVVHHLIRVLGSGGESAAANLVSKLGARAETARELAYRLYTICERKKRPAEALAYNGLVQSWPEITRLAQESGKRPAATPDMFEAKGA